MEEYINNMRNFCESATEMDFIETTVHCMEYFESSEGASYFRSRFLEFNIKEFKNDVDITKGKNYGQYEDVIVQFVGNAYVRIVEWWLKNEMPYPPRVMAE